MYIYFSNGTQTHGNTIGLKCTPFEFNVLKQTLWPKKQTFVLFQKGEKPRKTASTFALNFPQNLGSKTLPDRGRPTLVVPHACGLESYSSVLVCVPRETPWRAWFHHHLRDIRNHLHQWKQKQKQKQIAGGRVTCVRAFTKNEKSFAFNYVLLGEEIVCVSGVRVAVCERSNFQVRFGRGVYTEAWV